MISVNNMVICEPYISKRKIEATVNKGLATVKQKGSVVGLKVLADARFGETVIKKGSKVFLNEDYLYNNQSNLKPMESDGIEGSFILLNVGSILFIQEE